MSVGIKLLFRILGAFGSSFGFSVILQVPKKYLGYCGLAGAVGWTGFLLAELLGAGLIGANFVASVAAALVSQIFARLYKAPATLFYIPGIMPMVPGASIYRAAFYMIRQEGDLAAHYLLQTLQVAGVIAIGIFVVDAFFRLTMKRNSGIMNGEQKGRI